MKPHTALLISVIAIMMTLASLLCGIIFLHHYEKSALLAAAIWSCGAGLLLGLVAFVASLRNKAMPGARVCAVVAVLLCSPLATLVVMSRLSIRARHEFEKKHTLVHSMRVLHQAIHTYVQAHDGYLPVATTWASSLTQEDSSLGENTFRHPENPAIAVAYNANLSGLRMSDVPHDIVLFFEAQGGANLAGTQELLDAGIGSAIVDVMLIDGTVKEYWIEHTGVRAYDRVFVPLHWKP